MANIFGILTTVVLIIALFVASKNKSRYEDEILNVIAEKGRLKVSQERLATAQGRLGDINEEIPVVRARADELAAEAEEQRSANARVESEIQTKNNQVATSRNRISDLEEEINSFGDFSQMAQTLRGLQAEIDELENADDGIPARIAHLDRLNAETTQIEADNTTMTSILDGYERGESRPGLTTRIRSIYPTWGFVTLASGGIAGVAGESRMNVIRDGQVIARLQVTGVEPNSATATIIPDSMAEDVVLSVGDTVIPASVTASN